MMGLFFHAVLFCYCFLAFLFQCRLIDFLSRSSQLLDGLRLQDFSFSCVYSVVEVFFIKIQVDCLLVFSYKISLPVIQI